MKGRAKTHIRECNTHDYSKLKYYFTIMDRTLRSKSAISSANNVDNSSIISFDSPASFNKLAIQNTNMQTLAMLLAPFDAFLLKLANYPNGLFFDTLVSYLTNEQYFVLINSLYSLRYNTPETSTEFKKIVETSIHNMESLRRFLNIYDKSKISELQVAIQNSKLNNYNASVSGVRTMDTLVDNSFNIMRIVFKPEYGDYLANFGYEGDDPEGNVILHPYFTGMGIYM